MDVSSNHKPFAIYQNLLNFLWNSKNSNSTYSYTHFQWSGCRFYYWNGDL